MEVIAQVRSYTEISPSGTGMKVDFRYTTADTIALRRMMGTDHGKLFKHGKRDHPPAIELYIGNRYFAVTDQHLPGTPTELRLVDQATLSWLLTSGRTGVCARRRGPGRAPGSTGC